jgi:hypothetical protein
LRFLTIILLVVFFSGKVFSQDSLRIRKEKITSYDFAPEIKPKVKYWGLTGLSGEVKVGGLYRNQTTIRGDIEDNQQTTRITGGMRVKTGCYFWNPNFMLLDVDAEYNPETHQEKYLIIPDLAEVNTLKNLDIRTVFLNQKVVNFGGNITLNENYSNRENLSDIRSRSKSYGGFLNLVNKYAPVSFNYQHSKWFQEEIQTGRMFNCTQSELRGKVQTSFSKWDKHDLEYSHSSFEREDYDFYRRKNISDQLILSDDFHFDKKRHYRLNFSTSAFDRKLNTNYTRISTIENFNAELPKNFHLYANYAFYHIVQESQTLNQNNANLIFGHKLFNSLNTDIFGGYINSSQTYYKGADSKLGFDIRYNKKIPLKGNLSLSYKYTWNHKERESSSLSVNVFNEEYTLTDGAMVLLDKPYITASTIVVTDITGTIVYQQNFDYVLNAQGNYFEIMRIPGGLIANNSTVYIDYTYVQPGNYMYDAANNNFGARLTFFKNLVELYYGFSNNKYLKLMQTEFLQLNSFTQNLVGFRLNYQFASGGIEYIDYKSNIVPYNSVNYFVQLQGRFLKHFEATLNGNLRYMTLTDQNIKQNFANIAAMLAYSIKSNTRISIQGGYMHQEYQSINLDQINATAEFNTSWRKIFFTLGFQLYNRNYLDEKINYTGGYVQIARRF